MRQRWIVALGSAGVLAAAGVAGFFLGGFYDVSATKDHTQVLYTVMETAMHATVRRRAGAIDPPALGDVAQLQRGAACYRIHCAACHGGPGVAPGPAALGLQPVPGPLVDAARRWRPPEVYWIVRHGIKMSGMPAWEMRLSDGDLWAVTAFVMHLPALDAGAYARETSDAGECPADRAMRAPAHDRPPRVQAVLALQQHGCTACHDIPGAVDSGPRVGPPLAGFGRRTHFAGAVPLTRDSLVRWIQAPATLRPGTAMPDLQVSDEHAGQMADYLLTLK